MVLGGGGGPGRGLLGGSWDSAGKVISTLMGVISSNSSYLIFYC